MRRSSTIRADWKLKSADYLKVSLTKEPWLHVSQLLHTIFAFWSLTAEQINIKVKAVQVELPDRHLGVALVLSQQSVSEPRFRRQCTSLRWAIQLQPLHLHLRHYHIDIFSHFSSSFCLASLPSLRIPAQVGLRPSQIPALQLHHLPPYHYLPSYLAHQDSNHGAQSASRKESRTAELLRSRA